MVFQTFPDHDRVRRRSSRNNHALAALSRLLQDELSPHGLKVFDEFGVILPQQNNDTGVVGLTIYVVSPGKVFMDMSASLLSECS